MSGRFRAYVAVVSVVNSERSPAACVRCADALVARGAYDYCLQGGVSMQSELKNVLKRRPDIARARVLCLSLISNKAHSSRPLTKLLTHRYVCSPGTRVVRAFTGWATR